MRSTARSSRAHSPGSTASSTARGASPTSSARATGSAGGHLLVDLERSHHQGIHQVHRHLHVGADLQAEGPHGARRTHLGGHGPGQLEVRTRQPQVVGDEHGPGADTDGARPRIGGDGPDLGLKIVEGPAAHLGQRALGSVAEAGHAQLGGGPGGEAVPGPDRVVEGRGPERDERHHVDHPQAGMGAGVAPQVQRQHGRGRHRPGGLLADEAEHAAVVVGVGVDVEQLVPGVAGDQLNRGEVTPLADVDHALEHLEKVVPGSARCAAVRWSSPGDDTRMPKAPEGRLADRRAKQIRPEQAG